MLEVSRNTRKPKEMNLLPVINLVFLLLIFFLVAGTIEKFDIVPVDLPLADSGKLLDEGRVVVVLGLHDEILFNDEYIEAAELPKMLKEVLKKDPETVISVKGDAMLAAEKVIGVMDLVRQAGGKNLSLVTQAVE